MKETLNCNGELVTINGHNLHVYRAGNPDAPAIVFMAGHCTVSPVYDFKVLYEKLLQDFRVIVIENSATVIRIFMILLVTSTRLLLYKGRHCRPSKKPVRIF